MPSLLHLSAPLIWDRSLLTSHHSSLQTCHDPFITGTWEKVFQYWPNIWMGAWQIPQWNTQAWFCAAFKAEAWSLLSCMFYFSPMFIFDINPLHYFILSVHCSSSHSTFLSLPSSKSIFMCEYFLLLNYKPVPAPAAQILNYKTTLRDLGVKPIVGEAHFSQNCFLTTTCHDYLPSVQNEYFMWHEHVHTNLYILFFVTHMIPLPMIGLLDRLCVNFI